MSDDAYVTAYDTLKRERDLAEQRMLLLLSQDAVEQVAAGNRLDPEEPETDESDEADGIAPHG